MLKIGNGTYGTDGTDVFPLWRKRTGGVGKCASAKMRKCASLGGREQRAKDFSPVRFEDGKSRADTRPAPTRGFVRFAGVLFGIVPGCLELRQCLQSD